MENLICLILESIEFILLVVSIIGLSHKLSHDQIIKHTLCHRQIINGEIHWNLIKNTWV